MKLVRFLLISSIAVCLGGCLLTTKKGGSACDGWGPQHPKPATVRYIVKNDKVFAGEVLGHNEHGENIGCWKAGN